MTANQTPDLHAALRLKLRARSDHALGGHIRTEDLLVEAADALVQEKARTDALQIEVNNRFPAEEVVPYHDGYIAQKARADRLAAIVREARSSGGWDAVAVLAQAEAEGLLR